MYEALIFFQKVSFVTYQVFSLLFFRYNPDTLRGVVRYELSQGQGVAILYVVLLDILWFQA